MMAGPPCSLVSGIPCTPSFIDNAASVPAAIAINALMSGAVEECRLFRRHKAMKGVATSKTMATIASAALALTLAENLDSLAASLSGLILFNVAFQDDTMSPMRCLWPLPRLSVRESSRMPMRFLVGGNPRRQRVSPVVSKTSHIPDIPQYQYVGSSGYTRRPVSLPLSTKARLCSPSAKRGTLTLQRQMSFVAGEMHPIRNTVFAVRLRTAKPVIHAHVYPIIINVRKLRLLNYGLAE
ncbi:hypothetical protein B0I37DRAFT_384383 [Chaetomium sp. MPI-CAGE-AT-0009]|nr:hypothetical protein B0I37DRAFT_384383 [Chaetomium sp. MPI-CAGE-AT-0009]